VKFRNIKTNHNWDVHDGRALELALDPNYELISATDEEKKQLELLKEKEPPTTQELVFDYELL